jgi:hypothetical protein
LRRAAVFALQLHKQLPAMVSATSFVHRQI